MRREARLAPSVDAKVAMGRHLAKVPGSLGDLPQNRVPVEPLLHDIGVQARLCDSVAPARPIDAIPLMNADTGLVSKASLPGALPALAAARRLISEEFAHAFDNIRRSIEKAAAVLSNSRSLSSLPKLSPLFQWLL